jgi:glycosyltransferase involved in cell wall biosynthesis
MKVSLVATVKDARPFIEEFLASLRAQTRAPDEVVIVDGGSTDGTLEALESEDGVTVLSEPGANIATGRNVAVRSATHDVLAVTDADCVLAPDWLERILQPIERGADFSAGFYRPLGITFFQACAGAASLPEPEEVRPGWMPSSRSLAFRREVFEAVGGYPEWLDVGEDMYLNHRWSDAGVRMELATDAVAFWRLRATPAATWRQYAGYAEGDAVAGMYPRRHLVRFSVYATAVAAVATRSPWLIGLAAAGGVAYAARPIRRAWRRLPEPASRAAAVAAVPVAMAFIDAAKMWGYVRGLSRRRRRRAASRARLQPE